MNIFSRDYYNTLNSCICEYSVRLNRRKGSGVADVRDLWISNSLRKRPWTAWRVRRTSGLVVEQLYNVGSMQLSNYSNLSSFECSV